MGGEVWGESLHTESLNDLGSNQKAAHAGICRAMRALSKHMLVRARTRAHRHSRTFASADPPMWDLSVWRMLIDASML